MKTNIFLIICFITICNVKGQFSIPIKQDANDISRRILAVELLEVNSRIVKRLEKKSIEGKNNYLNEIKNYNDYIQKELPKYWKLNDSIIFLHTSKIFDIMEKKDSKYAVFLSGIRKEAYTSVKVIYTSKCYTFFLYFPEYSKGWADPEYVDKVDPDDASGMDKRKYIFKISFPSFSFNTNDFKLMCDLFYENIQKAKIVGKEKKIWRNVFYIPKMETNINILKKDTLLIPEKSISFDVFQIENIYSYPYKIVSFKEQEKLIETQRSGYIYFNILWDDFTRTFNYFLVQTENNALIERIGLNGLNISFGIPFFNALTTISYYRESLGITERTIDTLNKMVKGEIKQKNIDYTFQ